MRIRAKHFLAGLLIGSAALSTAGALILPWDLVNGFHRIHAGLNVRDFYITAREVRAILATVQPDRMIVVIGGTSVFQGTGQNADNLWTDHLQNLLGSRFFVVNLALRSGRSNELGNFAAEMLLKEHRRVLYVCDSMIDEFTFPIEKSRFKQIALDFWWRSFLINWPPRDRMFRGLLWSTGAIRQAAWGAMIDYALNFRDLWNAFCFEIAGVMWNPIAVTGSYDPLKAVADPEQTPSWYAARGYPTDEAGANAATVKSELLPASGRAWDEIRSQAALYFPPSLRLVSIVNVDLDSPHYLGSDGRFQLQADRMATTLRSLGFARVTVAERTFRAVDYVDRVHLAPSGGEKLAKAISEAVIELSNSRGYSR